MKAAERVDWSADCAAAGFGGRCSVGRTLSLSPFAAAASVGTLSTGYVFSLYIWNLLGYRDTNRDHPATIRRRILSVFFSCCFSAVVMFALTSEVGAGDEALTSEAGWPFLDLLGLSAPSALRSCLASLGLTCALFVGPLLQHLVEAHVHDRPLVRVGPFWPYLRNNLVAPATEEFVFRACMVRCLLGGGYSLHFVIWIAPLVFFSLPHVHHYFELRRKCGSLEAMGMVMFQVSYTWVFGIYATFLLVRTGSVFSPFLAHSFCNHIGLPDISTMLWPSAALLPHRVWLSCAYGAGALLFFALLTSSAYGVRSAFLPDGCSRHVFPCP